MTPVDHARLYNHIRLTRRGIGWPRDFIELAGVTIGAARRYIQIRDDWPKAVSSRPTYALCTDHWTARFQVQSITGVKHPEFVVHQFSDTVVHDRGPITLFSVEGDYDRYLRDGTNLKLFSHLWEDTDQPHR